ncbi:MAG: hypothetical protein Q4G28_06570 [Neisseria sp.]|nr:hypothetical protein [Neisseria sp.]
MVDNKKQILDTAIKMNQDALDATVNGAQLADAARGGDLIAATSALVGASSLMPGALGLPFSLAAV